VPVSDFAAPAFDLPRWKARVQKLEPRAAALLAQIEDARQLLPASYFDVQMPRYGSERLVFIGDAAHATSPQLGQGTNLALEDARSLGCCVSAYRELGSALAAYDAERRRHVRYYQLASWALTPFFQSSFSALGPVRDAVLGPLCRFPPSRRLMLQTLAGVQKGFLGSTVRLAPLHLRLSRKPA
jgi:2-polyprenyl-6-methoxyphenol hydroxylase-like FAD-dependent oxidoreductase